MRLVSFKRWPKWYESSQISVSTDFGINVSDAQDAGSKKVDLSGAHILSLMQSLKTVRYGILTLNASATPIRNSVAP